MRCSHVRASCSRTVGYNMPRIGLGVWQNKGESCLTACVAAIEHGYRCVSSSSEDYPPSPRGSTLSVMFVGGLKYQAH